MGKEGLCSMPVFENTLACVRASVSIRTAAKKIKTQRHRGHRVLLHTFPPCLCVSNLQSNGNCKFQLELRNIKMCEYIRRFFKMHLLARRACILVAFPSAADRVDRQNDWSFFYDFANDFSSWCDRLSI